MADLDAALSRTKDHQTEQNSWGSLVWMVSGELGNSSTMTIGRCCIKPGQANPRHYHPNCDEILHILAGTIEHSLNSEIVTMHSGDAISIPQGVMHNTRNVGVDKAVFVISFSTADRRTISED